jgi:hypothetical protein
MLAGLPARCRDDENDPGNNAKNAAKTIDYCRFCGLIAKMPRRLKNGPDYITWHD